MLKCHANLFCFLSSDSNAMEAKSYVCIQDKALKDTIFLYFFQNLRHICEASKETF